MNITLKDIANELNLSINTVSRALRNMPDVNQDTRQVVWEAAKRMGYRKNLAASRLRTRRSNLLGVVVTDFGNPAMSSIIQGAEDIARRTGYTLLLGSSNENAEMEERVVSNMISQGVDGLLLLPTMLHETLLDQIESEQIPYVLAVRKYNDRRCNIIRNDDLICSAAVADYLYGLGHRSFLYVSGLRYISSAYERHAGFVQALEKHGLPPEAVQVIECNGSRADAERALWEWLPAKGEKRLPVTAIFAFSDYVACGVYSVLQELGLRIPEDVSVVGYDNNEFASILTPALSTVDNHFFDIGRQSTLRLLNLVNRQIAGLQTAPQERVYPSELLLRQSTGPAPR